MIKIKIRSLSFFFNFLVKPFHICSGVTPPTNLDCFADNSTVTGYRFDCWEECEELPHHQVCSSDFGTYKTECHMQREACKMYGNNTVQMVSVASQGPCDSKYSVYTQA